MSEPIIPTPTFEERLSALENQCFVMYLQVNAMTKIFIDEGKLNKEALTKEMDDLNKQLYDVTMEMMEKTKNQQEDTNEKLTDSTPE